MASFWDNLKQKFSKGTVVTRLIFINVGIFLLISLVFALLNLFGIAGRELLNWIQVPAGFSSFIEKPWTVLTYMFVHYELMHVLMNMLWLYFFGSMFLRWFNERQLGVQYVLGGLAGALLFVLGYEFLPWFEGIQTQAPLIGASASIMALCVAVSVYRPNEPVSLFLLGSLKLKYLALIMIVLDLLSFNEASAGVGLAHLGGALWGMLVGLAMRSGKDLTAWINPLMNQLSKSFSRKPNMRVKYRRSRKETTFRSANVDQAYRDRKKQEADQLDTILDKLKQSGYDSLTKDEKKRLFELSDRSS